MNPQERVNLYREALVLIFGSDIAHRSRIYYGESTKGRNKIFWVNRPMRKDNGGFVLSPTDWKPFTPEEFDAETASLFRQAKTNELRDEWRFAVFTVRETARLMDVSEQNVYDLIRRKRLVLVEENGQRYVSPSSLVVYLQSRVDELKKFEKALSKLLKPIDK